MEYEGIIFTLFMVCLLLTVSISDNITGRASDIAASAGCICAKIPVCTKDGGKLDLCLNLEVKDEGVVPITTKKGAMDDVGFGETKEEPKEEAIAVPHVEKKEGGLVCADICDPFNHPDNPDWLIYSSKKQGDECVIDYSIPPENCKYSGVKNSECVLKENGEGVCETTTRAENYAKAAAEEEGEDAGFTWF